MLIIRVLAKGAISDPQKPETTTQLYKLLKGTRYLGSPNDHNERTGCMI